VESGGAYADLTLHAALRECSLSPRDRALATDLVYGTLRYRGRLDFLLGFVLDREFAKIEPRVATLLRLGAYQIAFCQRIPNSAAVDQAVRCAHSIGAQRAAGFVNAVLRRLSSRASQIPLPLLADDPRGHLTHALSLPSWLAERFLDRYGAHQAARLAEALLQIPPLTVRANPLRGGREALLAELRQRHPQAMPTPLSPLGIRLEHAGDPGREPALREGRLTVQDEGSQLVVELLEPRSGEPGAGGRSVFRGRGAATQPRRSLEARRR
jgi:16S rRNA (cytosine967-C5)-methyltransferase